MNPLITSDLDLATAEPDSEYDEKQADEVTNITPDDAIDSPPESTPSTVATQDNLPLADDYEAFKKEHFPPLDDLEIVDETINTWNITGWYAKQRKEHGPSFDCGGHPWRVLFFPFGNNQGESCSFYLEQAKDEELPKDWAACIHFMLVLWNPSDPSIWFKHSAYHRFMLDEWDWGFTRFLELRKLVRGLNNDGRALMDGESANMTAYVRKIKDPTGVLWHNFNNYDSKKETDMVGLKNQGATCYLNSLLQSLYFTNTFRKAIYKIPTEVESDARDNSAYALQRLFYSLQTNDTAVSTGELTNSFGWESRQIFEQQDVQELCRILMDRMEERMKGTDAENALPDLFLGQMKTYIQCINVDYESSRLEDFWDIQLNVRGNATLDDSFKDYVQVETMEGDNKYQAEGFGLQDAKKGVLFESFPPVLHLHLKRFEYNFQTDSMTKIYDRYEFPEIWDASPYLSETADRSESYIYRLYGVLVHSGDLNAGHYYAFLKPTKDSEFYRFDDDRVTRALKKEALDENFGGDFGNQPNGLNAQRNPYTRTWSRQKFMSAYMLVYVRETRLDSVLQPVTEADIPTHLERKINEERVEAERRRKDREEAHLYMTVIAITNDNFNAHQGFDIYPPNTVLLPENHPSIPKEYRLLRSMTVGSLIKTLSQDLGIEERLIRPWGLVSRQNGTTRPDGPLYSLDSTIEEASHRLQAKIPLRIWVEVASLDDEGQQMHDVATLSDAKSPTTPTLLFLKYFNAKEQALSGKGHLYIGKHQRIAEIGPMILERMGWGPGTNLKLYEEIKVNMIEAMKSNNTIGAAELQHGDIVCFQEVLPEEEVRALEQAGKYVDAPQFYKYLHHRVEINFSLRNDPENEDCHFVLELSKVSTYDQIAAKLGDHLKVDPTFLRFSTVSAATGKPRSFVRRTQNPTLAAILNPSYSTYGHLANQRTDWLFYEVLEMSLSELETKKLLKLYYLSEGITKEDVFDILVPRNGTIGDALEPLQKKANLSNEDMEYLRLYEAQTNKIHRDLHADTPVSNITDWVTIYAEIIPKDEREEESHHLVNVYHFDKEPNRTHGVPFKFVLKPGEVFSDTKERLSRRTGIKGKLLEKVKFAAIPRSSWIRPEYLDDDDVLSDKLVSGEDMLGLDHPNKTRAYGSKNDAMMIR